MDVAPPRDNVHRALGFVSLFQSTDDKIDHILAGVIKNLKRRGEILVDGLILCHFTASKALYTWCERTLPLHLNLKRRHGLFDASTIFSL